MTPEQKLEILTSLLKKRDRHYCEECDSWHEVDVGILEKEEILKLLNTPTGNE